MNARARVTWRWNACSRWRLGGVLVGVAFGASSFLRGAAPANDVLPWGRQ